MNEFDSMFDANGFPIKKETDTDSTPKDHTIDPMKMDFL